MEIAKEVNPNHYSFIQPHTLSVYFESYIVVGTRVPGRDLGEFLSSTSHIRIIQVAVKSTDAQAPPSRDSGGIGLRWGLHTHGLEMLPGDANVQSAGLENHCNLV